MDPITLLTVVVLAVFVGFEVVSKVSSTLHTPLMSGANAIHGVILLGAIIVTGNTDNTVALVVGLAPVLVRVLPSASLAVDPTQLIDVDRLSREADLDSTPGDDVFYCRYEYSPAAAAFRPLVYQSLIR